MRICSNCKEDIKTCDGGYGHNFVVGNNIICLKRKITSGGSLHFCDIDEFKDYLWDEKIYRKGKNAECVSDKLNETEKS